MKVCSRCKEQKENSEFNKSAKNKDGLHSYCRSCHSNHYKDNADRHKKRVSDRNKRITKELQQLAFKYLLSGCVDCGETNVVVLEFDHIDPSGKEYNVADLLRRSGSAEKLIKEIEKCQVRCANCHRIRTEKQRPSWRTSLSNGSRF